MKILVLLTAFLSSALAHAHSGMEQGLALTDAAKLEELDQRGFALTSLATPAALKTIHASLKSELALHAKKKEIGSPFDLRYLDNPHAHFVLVGIVNRADRGYATGNLCGEIRFIYRLAYDVIDRGKKVRSRLPLTMNLVFKGGVSDDPAHCRALAAAWIKMKDSSTLAEWLTNGPLSTSFFSPARLHALEFNVQASRYGAKDITGFGGHAQYILKVYNWNGREFAEATLENQIDRDALLANRALFNEFKAWLLQPANLKALDEGTILIPEKFLAKKAISVAPGGLARSANRPYYGVFKPEDFKHVSFQGFEQVKSANGLIRRLNDVSCAGCHQTRSTAGFHFTGLDPLGKYPGNSVYLPGSPHFAGDLPRRLSLLQAVARGDSAIDYSRGFAARPQLRRSQNLQGAGLLNGWGAHCSTGKDPSFKEWSCAEGLVCTRLLDNQDDSGIGLCLTPKQQVGSPCEFGQAKSTSFGVDRYVRTSNRKIIDLDPKATMCSPQSQDKGTQTFGFLGGNIRTLSCQDGPGEKGLPPEAACGPLPSAQPGFNACVTGRQKNFNECLLKYSKGVGLRACDEKNPCRDDYICAESHEPGRGVCAPPYFLFQLRVDGHPDGNL